MRVNKGVSIAENPLPLIPSRKGRGNGKEVFPKGGLLGRGDRGSSLIFSRISDFYPKILRKQPWKYLFQFLCQLDHAALFQGI